MLAMSRHLVLLIAGWGRAGIGEEIPVILQELGERSWPTTEKHRKIGRDIVVGRAVGGRDVGKVKRTPTWKARL